MRVMPLPEGRLVKYVPVLGDQPLPLMINGKGEIVGMHEPCGGRMIFQDSKLHCEECGLEVVLPPTVRTFGELACFLGV